MSFLAFPVSISLLTLSEQVILKIYGAFNYVFMGFGVFLLFLRKGGIFAFFGGLLGCGGVSVDM